MLNKLKKDWGEVLSDRFNRIPSLYKKSLAIIFLGLVFTFSFVTFHFITGNHDWDILREGIKLDRALAQARFSTSILEVFFLDRQLLPILSYVVAFVGFALGAVLLLVYWKLPKSLLSYALLGLLLVLQPFTLSWLYYSLEMVSHLWLPFFVILAFLLAEKIQTLSVVQKVLYLLSSLGLLVFSLGTYPAVINTMAVVLLGRITIDLLDSDLSKDLIKEMMNRHKYPVLSAVFSLVLYKLIVFFFKMGGILKVGFYNTESTPLLEIPARTVLALTTLFQEMWHYPFPFFSLSSTRALVLLFLLVLVTLFVKVFSGSGQNKIVKLVLVFGSFLLTVIASKSSFIIGNGLGNSFSAPRLDFYGLGFFHVFLAVVLFRESRITKNIALVLCSLILWISIVQNFYAQKVWKQGFEAEKMLWNRLIYRIESTQGFDREKDYTLFMVGRLPSYREKYYQGEVPNRDATGDLLVFSYDPFFAPLYTLEFYSDLKIKKRFTVSSSYSLSWLWKDPQFQEIALSLAPEIEKAQGWGQESAVMIKDDILLVVMNSKILEDLQKTIFNFK